MKSFKERKEEFQKSSSWGGGPSCPACRTRRTTPYPGCGCPSSKTGYGTNHIMEYHHACQAKKVGKVDAYELDKFFMELLGMGLSIETARIAGRI